jgi:GDP-mannose transporter
MLIMNKLAVHFLPAPSFVLMGQLGMSAAAVWIAGQAGFIKVDPLEKQKVFRFFFVAVAFLALIFANIKTLQYANVETFVVFRASTPLAISIFDYYLLGRELPSAKSWLCLLLLLLGAVVYVLTDEGFHLSGYYWVAAWYCIFCFDQIYIKHVVDNVKMESNWGRVYYSNLLACVPLVVLGVATGDVQTIRDFTWTWQAFLAFSMSCALGVAMSYFSFLARTAVSATYFSVIGNVCKFLTILINYFMWDHHANLPGLACLLVCLVCAYMYEPAPLRQQSKATIPI